MPNFRYRALTQTGEIVNGSLSAPNAAEVAHRIDYLGLIPVETIAAEGGTIGIDVAKTIFHLVAKDAQARLMS